MRCIQGSQLRSRNVSYAYLFFKCFFFLLRNLIHQNLISDKGGGGVSQFLNFSDKGAGGVGQFLTFADKGGGGVCTPPFLADVICE